MNCKLCGKEIAENKDFCGICLIKKDDPNASKIENYDALVRRVDKMVADYNKYPLMPSGNLSIEFIENVFNYNPLFVLDDLKKNIYDVIMEKTEFMYSQKELRHLIETTYQRRDEEQKGRIFNNISHNFSNFLDGFSSYTVTPHSYMDLRPVETQIFYYAFSLYYIAKDLKYSDGFITAKQTLKALEMFHCEKSSTPFDGIKQSGKLLNLSEFSRDRQVYDKLMSMIDAEIAENGNETAKKAIDEEHEISNTQYKKGKIMCYISLALSIIAYINRLPFFSIFSLISIGIIIISIVLGSTGIKKIKASGNAKTKIGLFGVISAIAYIVILLITIIIHLI